MKQLEIQTKCWIPQVIKVENGYIINLLSPKSVIMETYIYETFDDVSDFMKDQFNILLNTK